MEKVGIFCFLTILTFGLASAFLPHFPKSIANSPSVTLYLSQQYRPNGTTLPHRIVGGEIADEGQLPYQVSIQKVHSKENDTESAEEPEKGFHFCGGSLASSRVIISAGHCANHQEATKIRICLGTNHLGKENCKLLPVEKIILHHEYDSSQINNDISAFIMKDPVQFSNTVSPVTLPASEEEHREDTMTVVSGWGTTSEGGSVSEDLRYVEVPITSEEYCKECYGKEEITPAMICAGLDQGGKDSCQGDSGGPMVIKGSHTLAGIVSWGYGCARPGYPGVYTKVSNFVPWIENIVNTYS